MRDIFDAPSMAQLSKAVRSNRSRSQQGAKVVADDVFSTPAEIAEIAARVAESGSAESIGQNHAWSVVEPSAPLQTSVTTIAHYRFDETSGTEGADASRNDNDLTVSGATWATGKFGNCLSFDGTNDVATVTAVSAEPLRNYLYVSCWVKPSYLSGTRPIVKLAERFVLHFDAAELKVDIIDGATTYTVSSGMDAVVDTWQFITLQFNSGQVILGLDDLVYRETIALTTYTDEFPVAGLALTVGSDGTAFFAGLLDEVLVEANTRVEDDFPKVLTMAGPNDVIFWPFLENAGTSVFDVKVLAEELTLHGGTWTSGRTLYGVSFDGVDDYADCTPVAETFTDRTLSIEVGIKFLADEETPIITQAGGLNLQYDGAGGIVAALGGVSNPTSVVGQLTVDSDWHNLVIVYDGTNKECWLDGMKIGQVACTGTATMPAVPMYIAKDGTTFGNFVIDRVRVYRARLRPYYRFVPYFIPGTHGFTSTEPEWMVAP